MGVCIMTRDPNLNRWFAMELVVFMTVEYPNISMLALCAFSRLYTFRM